ncbi:MAG: hypothetical protein MUF87_07425 [Anaerolineae bacterium]|jgi:Tat protein translocase TatB subunit|nr:hypothetical protein [Anaerolineae bacterium]
MNIFGIGELELVLILMIALVVAGPKRLIQWAYFVGRWTTRLRVMWSDMMNVVQKELDESGVDIELPKEIPTRQSLNRTIQNTFKPLTDPMRETLDEVRKVGDEVKQAAQQTRSEISGITSPPKTSNGAPPVVTPKPTAPTPTEDRDSFGSWSS